MAALFSDTVINKVDRKGRVSVPAPFRNELAKDNLHDIAVYPSLDDSRSLTGCGEDVLKEWSANYRAKDPFDTESAAKRMRLFGAIKRLPFDADGRVLLPEDLRAHAGITTHAVFVGMGHEFRISNPATHKAAAPSEKKTPPDAPAGPDTPSRAGEDQ